MPTCQATRKDGTPCERPVAAGRRYCWQHSPVGSLLGVMGYRAWFGVGAVVAVIAVVLSTLLALGKGSKPDAISGPSPTAQRVTSAATLGDTPTSSPAPSSTAVPASDQTPSPTATPTSTDEPYLAEGIELCDGANYGPPCTVFTEGRYADLSDYVWADRAESLRFLGSYVGIYHVVLLTEPDFGGIAYHVDGDVPDLGQVHRNRVRSLEILPISPPMSAPADAPPVSPLPTQTPEPSPSVTTVAVPAPTASPTNPPSVTPTRTQRSSATPTYTPVPTATPSGTATGAPVPTLTTTPSPIPTRSLELLRPPPAHVFDKRIAAFEWVLHGVLGPNEDFRLQAWKAGEAATMPLDVKTDRRTTWEWWPQQTSEYEWWVVLVDEKDGEVLSSRVERFSYVAPPPAESKPSPTPPPPPTEAPPPTATPVPTQAPPPTAIPVPTCTPAPAVSQTPVPT